MEFVENTKTSKHEYLITKFVQTGLKPEGTEHINLSDVIKAILMSGYKTCREATPTEVSDFRKTMGLDAFKEYYLDKYVVIVDISVSK